MNTMIALPIAAALPVAAPAMPSTADQGALDDGALLKLEEQIFEHKEAISKLQPEAERLAGIWSKKIIACTMNLKRHGPGRPFTSGRRSWKPCPNLKSACGCVSFRSANAKRLTAS